MNEQELERWLKEHLARYMSADVEKGVWCGYFSEIFEMLDAFQNDLYETARQKGGL